MLALSHDGTYAPQHVIARHTYADTWSRLAQEQAEIEAEAAEAYAAAVEELQPLSNETFWLAVRTQAGWRAIYTSPSPLTRPLAVRLARARRDPQVLEVALYRSKGQPERLAYAMRRFREVERLSHALPIY